MGSFPQRKKFLEEILPTFRKLVGVNEKAICDNVLFLLVGKGEYLYATQLLFGATREQIKDPFGVALFLELSTGRRVDLIAEIVNDSHWSNRAEGERALSIRVYPGEYLIIHEETAEKIHESI